MKRLKQWLLPLLTLVLVAAGAAMPWAVFQIQDAYVEKLQEERSLDEMSLTLRQESELAQALRLMAEAEYEELMDFTQETRLTPDQALDAAMEAVNWMQKCGLVDQDLVYQIYSSPSYANAWLLQSIRTPALSTLVWDCGWPDSGTVHLRVDDATGKLLLAIIQTPPPKDVEDIYARMENWMLFIGDHYDVTVYSVEESDYKDDREFIMTFDLEDGGEPFQMVVHIGAYVSSMFPYTSVNAVPPEASAVNREERAVIPGPSLSVSIFDAG